MDIFHIASGDTWAGAEAQVAMLVAAQRQRGHRVRVATFTDADLADRLTAAGVDTRVVDERMGAAHMWHALREWLIGGRPAVLHAHGYKEALLGFSASVGLGIARVRTQHGVPELPVGGGAGRMRFYVTADRILARALRVHWIAVSYPIELDLRKSFGPRVHRVVNAVSVLPPSRSAGELRGELGLGAGGNSPVLLYAGRLEPIKGPDVLLEAFHCVLQRQPSATLLMAGSGSSEPLLREQISRLGLLGRVHLLGSRRDVFDLMALADLFVLPSRGEGMPTVLLEALACGCPVVASAVGAIPEVTRDGALAILVSPERPLELAASCVALLEDPVRLATMVKAGVSEIAVRYSPERAAGETDAVYAAALGETRRNVRQDS